ncbi:MAG: tRNA pseudouridine(55) synthase TruB [Clostridia bacterium]|nr:tRNA pseudouridine(55) synthase TruB [Clostridia bacterium]
MNGIFNILKPSGMSSNAVLTKIKKRFNIKKVGHLGTLDPLATGVLPITIGKGTKLFDYFLKKDKGYLAIFTFGKTTATLDSEGEIIKTSDIIPTKEQIKSVLLSLEGEVDQVPPNFSAKNINGQRAYTLARENVDFVLPPKRVHIYNIELLEQVNKTSYLFDIKCNSGTYIRSIVRDMAEKLGTIGYMSGLIRTKSGDFEIDKAITIEELMLDNAEEHLISLEEILKNFKRVDVAQEFYDKLTNGVALKIDIEAGEFLLYCKDELFGIASSENGQIKVKVNLKSA